MGHPTLATDIDKRWQAKTGVRPLDECLSELQSVLKSITRAKKNSNVSKSVFQILAGELVDKYTSICAEKDL